MAERVAPPQAMPWEEGAERRHSSLLGHLQHLLQHLTELRRVQDLHAPKRPFSQLTTLAALTPFKVDRGEFHYLRVYATQSAVLTVDAGAGPFSLPLMVGWNNLDLPEGSTITCAPATNVVVELTDYTPAPAS